MQIPFSICLLLLITTLFVRVISRQFTVDRVFSKALQVKTDEEISDPKLSNQINVLEKHGWSRIDALRALNQTNFDTSAAVSLLLKEEEGVEQLLEFGWQNESARYYLLQSDYNITLANELLQAEEDYLITTYDELVKNLIKENWPEEIARPLVFCQWFADTSPEDFDDEKLESKNLEFKKFEKSIFPSLRRSEDPAENQEDEANSNLPEKIVEINADEHIFHFNNCSFQEIVLQSDIPVLVLFKADWCHSSETLYEILGDFILKSGGLFRLVTIDSDEFLFQIFGVTGFPSLFFMNGGRVIDRLVGVPSSNTLKTFLLKSCNFFGFGKDKISDPINLNQISDVLFQKNELFHAIKSIIDKPEAWENDVHGCLTPYGPARRLSVGLTKALQLFYHFLHDFEASREQVITSENFYHKAIIENSAACELLEVAGFQKVEDSDYFKLSHNNSKIISAVVLLAEDLIDKFLQNQNEISDPNELRMFNRLLAQGWTKEESIGALTKSNFDFRNALEILKRERNGLTKLLAMGWKKTISRKAIQASDGDYEKATILLLEKEDDLKCKFNESLQKMTEEGWNEYLSSFALSWKLGIEEDFEEIEDDDADDKHVWFETMINLLSNLKPSISQSAAIDWIRAFFIEFYFNSISDY